MRNWEYKTITDIDGPGHRRSHDQNECGAEGWELVAVIEPGVRRGARTGDMVREFYYKRPLKS